MSEATSEGVTAETARHSQADHADGGAGRPQRRLVRELGAHVGQRVLLLGWVHQRRDLGGIQFLHVRDRSGMVQCVFEGAQLPLHESAVQVTGRVVESAKAPDGIEVHGDALELVSLASTPPPIEVAKETSHANPDTLLEYRHVSVRGLQAQATLRVKAALVRAFREHLQALDFTEIFTPKLVAAGAEGGANLFEVDYYGQRAYLAQSPQLYKQIMVAVFERVFETAPVYRAERHHTTRHLAEYLSLDVEFGFIDDDGDVMELQERLLKAMVDAVGERCPREVARLGAELPDTAVAFPRISLLEARALVAERYGHETGGKDLDPEAERLIGRWAKEEHGSDFVFVTHYPSAARPFYTYPTADGLTRGLDLIFRGVEITSGGQRVHEHDVLVRELEARGMDPVAFAGYLDVFKHGMPPHGGFAIGAERLTALLLGIPNIRFARAFPRDGGRLLP
jgi:nondiscriminating aspartyl-tRNA synthetase